MRVIFKAYESLLHRYPITITTLQTGILVGAGDAISQTLIERKNFSTYDFKRTIQFFCVGIIYLGPTLTVWYRVLDKLVGHGGKYSGLKKMTIDQICFAPFGIAGFLLTTNAVQGKSLPEIKDTFKALYPQILLANYKLWPAVQVCTFTFVPLQHRVLFVQTFALIWNTYICYKTKSSEA